MLERDFYPLTSPQFSIWYTEKMYAGTSISNISGTIRIKEDNINYGFLEKALKLYIKNNESIRLRICVDENGEPRQYAYPYEDKPVDFIDFSKYEDPISAMYEWNANEAKKPLRLLDSDLYRFVILKISDKEGGIYSNFHHIIFDAWSMALSCSLVMGYYKALKTGDIEQAEQIDIPSYISYVKSEMDYYKSNRMKKDAAFWEEVYDKPIEATVLKTRKTNLVSTESKRKTFVAPKKFVRKLRQYCAENRTTLYPLFLSALSMYVNRVTGKEDIIIGTPILNRLNQTEKNTVGMFVSTVPLRIKVSDETSFTEFSHSILQICSSSYRHQRYPYELILKKVREKHDFPGNLYDIVLSYQNSKYEKTDIDYSTRWHFNGHQSNSLTIHVNDRDDDETVIIDYDYHKDLYYDKEIEFIHHHLLSLLWHALDNPEKKICTIEMLPESEKRKVLYEFNNTEADYPKDKTIHQLFEQQVTKTPDNIALICDDKSITYKELNEKANSLAVLLREKGIKPGDVIGILVSRSIEMVIGMLAVLKAGAAFLPIDRIYPTERVNYMLQNSNAKLLLTDCDYKNMSDKNETIDCINLFDPQNYVHSDQTRDYNNNPENLAYIIYTSGSTGKPKGVMIKHRSLINFVYGLFDRIDYDNINTVLSITSFSFDVFFIESFPALYKGNTLVMANDTERKDPVLLARLIKKYCINMVVSTPSQMHYFLKNTDFSDSLHNIYEIVLAGEKVTKELLSSLKDNTNAIVLNGYGPTETTVIVTSAELTKTDKITIGKPMNNAKIYILDKDLLPVPIGIVGEIYIGGHGLAMGYINNKELTDSVFIQSPFSQDEKLYRSGDLGRWLAKGEIDILGRADSQIKIRGFRIELGEIEKRILEVSDISKVHVTVIDNDTNKKLCAYFVSNHDIDIKQIKGNLKKYLPMYMIPAFFIRVDKIPLSPNGKIDERLLPKPDASSLVPEAFSKPATDLEKELFNIWADVLQEFNFGVDSEFIDVGGDSLSIIQIVSKISLKYQIEIPISIMNESLTIKKMTEYIQTHTRAYKDITKSENIIKITEGGQKNIFLVHAGNGEAACYFELGNMIDKSFNVWGIQAVDEILYSNKSIYLLADRYVDNLQKIQPKGPYYLAGWCIGGTIAFEMAGILERKGHKVGFLGLMNSIAPENWEGNMFFNEQKELEFLIDILGNGSPGELSNEQLWQELFDKLLNGNLDMVSFIKILPEDIRQILPRQCTTMSFELVKYLKRIVFLHKIRSKYYPHNKVKCRVSFYSALLDKNLADYKKNVSGWNKYCFNPVSNIVLEADHYSLLSQPSINIISKDINIILNEQG
jgi:amino acid adenylation domain-containing protein